MKRRQVPLMFDPDLNNQPVFIPNNPNQNTNTSNVYNEIKENVQTARNTQWSIERLIERIKTDPNRRAEVQKLENTARHIQQGIEHTVQNMELTEAGRTFCSPWIIAGGVLLLIMSQSK